MSKGQPDVVTPDAPRGRPTFGEVLHDIASGGVVRTLALVAAAGLVRLVVG